MIQLDDVRVEDVMTPFPRSLSGTTTVPEAARFLTRCGLLGAPVVGEDGELIGAIGLEDLLAAATSTEGSAAAVSALTLAGLPAPEAVTCEPATTLPDACKLMVKARTRLLVVLRDGRPAGIVSATDAVRVVAALDEVAPAPAPTFEPIRERGGHPEQTPKRRSA